MAMAEGVNAEMADHIMTVTINRPESRNSLDLEACASGPLSRPARLRASSLGAPCSASDSLQAPPPAAVRDGCGPEVLAWH